MLKHVFIADDTLGRRFGRVGMGLPFVFCSFWLGAALRNHLLRLGRWSARRCFVSRFTTRRCWGSIRALRSAGEAAAAGLAHHRKYQRPNIFQCLQEDFQIQWGPGGDDFGTCLLDMGTDTLPDDYSLKPGYSRQGTMLFLIPNECTTVTLAYQETRASGKPGNAYFVEIPL